VRASESPIAPTSSEVPPSLEEGSRLERWIARGVLSLWFPAVLVVCAYLLGGHVLTLPSPTSDSVRLTSAFAAIRDTRDSRAGERWIALHVLYEGCRCSTQVLDHLLARGVETGTTERVVLVRTGESAGESNDPSTASRIKAAGFDLEVISTEDLANRYGIEAAPLLVVSDPQGAVRYVGGYTDRKQSVVIHDHEIIASLRGGAKVAPLPVFGCAVSKELGRRVDPLGLRR
jgi:hypothetical protein